MQQVIYREAIRQAGSLLHLAQQATRQLEEVLGSSADLVSAEWDRAEDAFGRSVILLRLTDFTGSVTAVFEPRELEQPTHLPGRLRRLWGDLLQIRAHKQLQKVLGTGGGEGDN